MTQNWVIDSIIQPSGALKWMFGKRAVICLFLDSSGFVFLLSADT